MKRKYIYILMQILSSVCMISVGFASWTIVTPPIIAEGDINSEPVLSADDYLVITIDDLKFCEEGFVNEGKISNVGYLKLNCKLQNLAYFNTIFCTYDEEGNKTLDFDSLRIELTLSYDGYNLFETTSNQSSTHIIDGNGINITNTYPMGKKYNKYSTMLTINNILSIVEESKIDDEYTITGHEFTITYMFTYTGNDFSPIYNSLKNNSSFKVDVKLEGCNRA